MSLPTLQKLLAHLGGRPGDSKVSKCFEPLQDPSGPRCITHVRRPSLRLKKKAPGGLQLDRQNPYSQIAKLWTAIFQGRERLYTSDVLHRWCVDAIGAMQILRIPEEKKAQAWAMLGSLYYKSLRPDWDGDANCVEPCPEAKRCYQEAVRLDSQVDRWNKLAQRF